MVTLQELKTYLGISGTDNDAQLNLIITMLPAYVKLMTGRWYGALQEVTETYDYAPTVFLANADIDSITYVKRGYDPEHDFDDSDLYELIDPSDYRWNKLGRISLSSQFFHNKTKDNYDEVVVKYKYGNATVPADIKLAAMMFAGDAFNAIDGEVTEETLDTYKRKYTPSTSAANIFDANRMVNL
jgi:hypothetical protein